MSKLCPWWCSCCERCCQKSESLQDLRRNRDTNTEETNLQYLSTAAVSLAFMSLGSVEGWVSPVIFGEGLKSYSKVTMNNSTKIWITVCVPVSQMFFLLPSVYLADSFGRQPVLFSCFVPLTLSWLIILASKRVEIMIAARVVAGIGVAMVYAVGPTSVMEVAGKNTRGRDITICYALYHAGILFEFLAAKYLEYDDLAAASAIVPVIFAAAFIFMPETPHYLVISRREEAEAALKRLRSFNDPVKLREELNSIEKSSVETLQMKWAWRQYFFSHEARGSVFLSLTLMGLNEMCLLSVMIKVLDGIWRMDTPWKENREHFLSIVVASFLLASSLFTSTVVELMGRRTILIATNFLAAIFLFLTGLYSYVHLPYRWIHYIMIGGFVSMLNVGGLLLVIPVVLEITPTKYRATAGGVTNMEIVIVMMIGINTFLPLCDAIGTHTMFWFCALICLIEAVFVIVFVPETSQRTFAEMQEDINKRLSFLRRS